MGNGPTGGSPADVALKQTVIAATDPVAVDACAAKAYWTWSGTRCATSSWPASAASGLSISII